MKKNLTTSVIERQNILNNRYALDSIQEEIGFTGFLFENEYRFTLKQVADFFEIDERTVKRYLESYHDELTKNGYEVLRTNRLKKYMLAVKNSGVRDIDVPHKTRNLGTFNFRSFLNLGMLLTESEKAKILRSAILDIVIDTINKRTGGGTKYINQQDEDFVITFFKGEDFRREFTDALRDYVDMGKVKYAIYTDKIYRSIFRENTQEYRKILRLHSKEKVRETMYCEVLRLISSYEVGLAEELKKAFNKVEGKLQAQEVDQIFKNFENHRLWIPLVEDARTKMASRDLGFRDALHLKLKEYISSIPIDDFEKFIGAKSKTLEEQLRAAEDVFKRLKERG